MTPSQNLSRNEFSNTRWSVVLRQTPASPEARNALSELLHRYGYPVYACIRRCGHAPKIAREMSHAFLQNLLGEFQRTDHQRRATHYRQYLLERLHDFLAGEWRDAVGSQPAVALADLPDMEPRYARDHAAPGSPDHAFQRSFAIEVLYRAMRRLREEATQTGHLDMFSALEPYLARDPEAGVCEQLAGPLHLRPMVLIMALKRLRQRLRELTADELADTVGGEDDLVAEQESLLSVLREQN
ncbi:MAG: hypothetical protein JSS28_06645 [Proteobacteria bacterium]|nr:hypothetical protein [Pseudomonadota bacterium]